MEEGIRRELSMESPFVATGDGNAGNNAQGIGAVGQADGQIGSEMPPEGQIDNGQVMPPTTDTGGMPGGGMPGGLPDVGSSGVDQTGGLPDGSIPGANTLDGSQTGIDHVPQSDGSVPVSDQQGGMMPDDNGTSQSAPP